MATSTGNSIDVVAIREIGDGTVFDHFPVERGSTAAQTFEYYANDLGLMRCRRAQAEAEAILVSVPDPVIGMPVAAFCRQIAAAAATSKVSFGFVRRAEPGAD